MGRTGASRFRADTAAFKQCMLGRGYRWKSVERVPTPRARVSQPDTPSYEPEPPPPFEMPPTVEGPTLHVDPNSGEVLNY